MDDCKHGNWTVMDFELSPEVGGPYAVFMLRCRDCGLDGEFSDHIRNVVQDEVIAWQAP